MRAKSRYAVVGLLMAGLLAFGMYVRTVPANTVVFQAEGEVRLLGADPYYHLRHARYSVEHFPHVQRWDVATRYPHGHKSRTAGVYDLAMAGAALIVGGGDPSEVTLGKVVAWAPAVLGVLTILALFGLCRRLLDTGTALLACAIVTLYPGRFLSRTYLGFSDHHAAEVLLFFLSVWGAAAAIAATPTTRAKRWLLAFARTLPLVLLLFTWAGSPIVALMIAVGITAVSALAVARGDGSRELGTSLFCYGSALLVWLLACRLLYSDLIMAGELFTPLVLLAAGTAAIPSSFLAIGRLLSSKSVNPKLVAAGLVLISAALGVFVLTTMESGSWMLRQVFGRKLALIVEHEPVTLQLFWKTLGIPGLLALVAPVLLSVIAWTDRRRDTTLFLSLIGVMFFGLWCRTWDYEYFMPPVSAALAAAAVWGTFELWSRRRADGEHPDRHKSRSIQRGLTLGGFVLLVAVPVWPLSIHDSPLTTDDEIEALIVFNDGWFQAMAWLRDETPPPTLSVDARLDRWDGSLTYPSGTYGVATAWGYGNIVSAVGLRHTVVSQGVNDIVARWLLKETEAESLEFFESRLESAESVRYVVLNAETLGNQFATILRSIGQDPAEYFQVEQGQLPVYGPSYSNSIAARLYIRGGNGLSHHRLVYQSPHQTFMYYRLISTPQVEVQRRCEPVDDPAVLERYEQLREQRVIQLDDGYVYGALLLPSVRIFEIVEGVILTGIVSPGVRVQARLDLLSRSDGQSGIYQNAVEADEEGRFELTLPYATDESSPSDVRAEGPYRIEIDDGHDVRPWLELDVTEAQVRSGWVIEPRK